MRACLKVTSVARYLPRPCLIQAEAYSCNASEVSSLFNLQWGYGVACTHFARADRCARKDRFNALLLVPLCGLHLSLLFRLCRAEECWPKVSLLGVCLDVCRESLCCTSPPFSFCKIAEKTKRAVFGAEQLRRLWSGCMEESPPLACFPASLSPIIL